VKVAMIQAEAWGNPASFDVERNRATLLDLVERVCEEHRPDFVGLPEVSTAPYFCASHDPQYWELAEPIPGPTSEALGELAKRYSTIVAAGLFERAAAGQHYGACMVIGPDGKLIPGRTHDGTTLPVARKIHIPAIHSFTTSTDEKFWFRPGEGLVNFETRHGTIGVLICYDRSFPEAWRTLVLAGADAIFVPVVSYGFREQMFLSELQTRASENGVWVMAANRTGPEAVEGREVIMFGNSCVIDPAGQVVARAASGSEGKGFEVVVADIDLAEARAQRIRVPYFRDRRPDVYKL
jgi:beta-ureidopropionase